MNWQTSTFLFLSGFVLLTNSVAAQNALEFDNVWIAEAPPGTRVMAAYMDIKNTSDETHRIKSPQSGDFNKIEFHRTFHKNGMARMQHQPEIVIPAHSTLRLEPGGYHMMLFNPARKLKAGDQSTFSFRLESNHNIQVVAPVKKPVFRESDDQSGNHVDHSHH